MPVEIHLRSKEMSAKKDRKEVGEKGKDPAKHEKNQQEIKPRNHRDFPNLWRQIRIPKDVYSHVWKIGLAEKKESFLR